MHATDLFYLGARNWPDRLAFTGDGGDWTYGAAMRLASRIARQLIAEGLSVGTRFAVLSPNCGPAMIAIVGALRAGSAWCNLNMRNAPDDNAHILSAGRCDVLFYHSSAADLARQLRPRVPSLKRVICLDAAGEDAPDMTAWCAGQPETAPELRIPEDALGFQGATGGTTGRSKLTQGPNRLLLFALLGWSTTLRFDQPPVNLAMTPITHAAGIIAMGHFQFGGTTIMMSAVDLDRMFDEIERRRVTTLFLPPTVIYMMLAHPRVRTADLSSLRYLISAAAPIAPEKIIEAVETIGPVLCQAFGQTESGFPLTFISPSEIAEAVAQPALRHRLLSCGRPTHIVEAMEAMDESGTILPVGETGEIVLRGLSVMTGYLDDPAATAEIQKFGWHHTGDIGYRDADGYVYITDRKRDMIVSGGFNIFPFEIESVLMSHPAVQDCAVIGVPDEKWGEAVKAVVQLAPGQTATPDELLALCRTRLGGMKTPKSIDFVDSLPRSPVGKVLKRELRRPFWEGRSRAVG